MTPGFWLIVGMAAICLAAGAVWLADRVADAYDALTARRAAQLEEDAAVFDPSPDFKPPPMALDAFPTEELHPDTEGPTQ